MLTGPEHESLVLDDILCRWHLWAQSSRLSHGFNRRAVVVGDFKISRQYDDTNGQLDADLDKSEMHAVEFAVTQMVDPYKAAIYAQARALVVGVAVFNSPRLPLDRAERDAVVAEARRQLTVKLKDAGVM